MDNVTVSQKKLHFWRLALQYLMVNFIQKSVINLLMLCNCLLFVDDGFKVVQETSLCIFTLAAFSV